MTAFRTPVPPAPREGASTRAALVMCLLTALFAARVLAQLVQRERPVPWLPAFDAFQGSNLTYPVLLAAQMLILAAMIGIIARLAREPWQVPPLVQRLLAVFGWIYFGVMAARLAIGVLAPHSGAWFTAWIPAVFHLVLAAFVLAWAACLRTRAAQPVAGASA